MAYQTYVSSNLVKKHSEVETILTKDNINNYFEIAEEGAVIGEWNENNDLIYAGRDSAGQCVISTFTAKKDLIFSCTYDDSKSIDNISVYKDDYFNGDISENGIVYFTLKKGEPFFLKAMAPYEMVTVNVIYSNLKVLEESTIIESSSINTARPVSNIYIGVPTTVPSYNIENKNINIINDTTLEEVFDVEVSYIPFNFENNQINIIMGEDSCDFSLTALMDGIFSFDLSVTMDMLAAFQITLNNSDFFSAAGIDYSSLSKSFNLQLKKGDVLYFSVRGGFSDMINFTMFNIHFEGNIKTITGIEQKNIAHKIKKAYIGVPVHQIDGTIKSTAHLWWDTFLEDFEYINNNDGTYTLTAWKETYKGQPSKKLVTPDDERVIL